jgi:DNA primase
MVEQKKVNRNVIHEHFVRSLHSMPEAVDYLLKRGVAQEQIDNGLVGFCPPSYNLISPLIRGRVVVPIRNVHGEVVAFAGRQYDPLTDKTLKAIKDSCGDTATRVVDQWIRGKWINEKYSKSKHLYFLHEARQSIREKQYVILVEGYFDALVLHAYGIENVCALCGVALSEYHLAMLKRYCDHVVLLLDGDEAGELSAVKMLPRIEEAEMQGYQVYLPSGWDPDDFVRHKKNRAAKLVQGIEAMMENGDGKLRIKVK